MRREQLFYDDLKPFTSKHLCRRKGMVERVGLDLSRNVMAAGSVLGVQAAVVRRIEDRLAYPKSLSRPLRCLGYMEARQWNSADPPAVRFDPAG